jgi:hypothetical protein
LGRSTLHFGVLARLNLSLSLSVLVCVLPALAQTQPPPTPPPVAPAQSAPAQQPPIQQSPCSVSGTILDLTGAAVVGAKITLLRDAPSSSLETLADGNGQFSFAGVAPGTFRLTIASPGFAAQTISGTLHPGEIFVLPPIALAVAAENTEVQVVVPKTEVAEVELKTEEKQRVLGFIPNFYVSYIPNPVPLTPKQKFELAWRSSIDPVTFVLTGAAAGLEQAQDNFHGYGQGAQGYGKRYGAAYADGVTATFLGSALLPSLLKQDPRYFYKGTGSISSRLLYALANAVICKGDNRRWQPNYSAIVGDLAAGGISNFYYPSADREGLELTFENALIGIGTSAASNVLQEFVIRKLTPKLPHYDQSPPDSSSPLK